MSSMVRRRGRRSGSASNTSPRTLHSPHNGDICRKYHRQRCYLHIFSASTVRCFIWLTVISALACLTRIYDETIMKYDSEREYESFSPLYDDDDAVSDSNERRPRIVFYKSSPWSSNSHTSSFMVDPILSVNPGEECIPQPDRKTEEGNNCVPMESWQTAVFPTCNIIHELDIGRLDTHSDLLQTKIRAKHMTQLAMLLNDKKLKYFDYTLNIIGKGWFRHTWLLSSPLDDVVLKTLRLEREFHEEIYEAHRVDALAMERLTKSPYVIDIYSHCGHTAINEYASFGNNIHEFKHFTKELRNKTGRSALKMKLEIAAMIAQAVQHVHEIGGKVNNATMMHYDINPSNVVMTRGGIPKLNDFNVAHLFYWDPTENKRCTFTSHLTTPWWRAPEEMEEGNAIDEMVDIYSLGNILFQLLGGHSPRGRSLPERVDLVRSQLIRGIPPPIHPRLLASEDPRIVALIQAINKCYQPNPQDRSNAGSIASDLLLVIKDLYPKDDFDLGTPFDL